MIRNVSYRNKNIEQEIEELVGRSYPLLDRIKMSGNGSPRLKVLSASKKILDILEKDNYINYCHVEIRPGGIVVGLRSKLESYSWCIPFYKLYVSQNKTGYRIYSDTEHVVVNNNKGNVGAFFRKLLNYKTQFLRQENFN